MALTIKDIYIKDIYRSADASHTQREEKDVLGEGARSAVLELIIRGDTYKCQVSCPGRRNQGGSMIMVQSRVAGGVCWLIIFDQILYG